LGYDQTTWLLPLRPPTVGVTNESFINSPGFAYGSGRRMSTLTALKIAVVAPMPMASVSTATAVNAGRRASPRAA